MRENRKFKCCIGVDGCHGGWLAVIDQPNAVLAARVFSTFAKLIETVPRGASIGIDIPIGLTEKGARVCELEARQRLGRPRMSSVFPAPLRVCLPARDYEAACAFRYRIEGKKMSNQAYGILAKIREVDRFLDGNKPARIRVAEVHPEVSFTVWNGGSAMGHNKKKQAERAERRAMIDLVWPGQLHRLRKSLRGQDYQIADLHDAFAALWSVKRWARGKAAILGDLKAKDRKGLPMRMVV